MSKCNGAYAGGGAVYGLGFLGAVVFYLQQAHGLVEILLGIGKAIFWPAFMVYQLLGFLGR